MKTIPDFKLIAFYPLDAQKGKPAAKVACYECGILIDTTLMGQDDIVDSVRKYGTHPELVRAANAYQSVGEAEVF